MGKYQVNYRCGHTEIIAMFGKFNDRLRRIETMEEDICPDCRAAIKAQAASAKGYPDLVGTPKQVRWAVEIRDKMAKIPYDEYLRSGKGLGMDARNKIISDYTKIHGVWASTTDFNKTAYEYAAKTQTQSAWWIEAQYNPEMIVDAYLASLQNV